MEHLDRAAAFADFAATRTLAAAILVEAADLGDLVRGCKGLESCLDQSGVLEPDDFQAAVAVGLLALQEIEKMARKAAEHLENVSALVLKDSDLAG